MSSRTLNQKQFAATIGVTPRRVRDLEEYGLPEVGEGREKAYPVPEAVQWYIDRKRDEALNEVEQVDYNEAKARREAARARKEEIELEKQLGDLVTREAVQEQFGDEMLDRVRSSLLNMPGRWGAQLGFEDPRDGEKVLKEIAREILDHLSGPAADELEIGGGQELPEDFPGRSKLVEAGVETYADLLAVDDLQEIHGIGPATEEKIVSGLEGRDAA